MFKNNKYHTWYNNIIDRAKSRTISGYKENHHIIPRSLGGNNTSDNIVALTAKEHYIVHLLLPYMVIDPVHQRKMWGALRCMSKMVYKTHKRYVGSARFYEKARENTDFGAGNRGRIQTEEEKIKRANSLKGHTTKEETKKKIGLANSRFKGRTPWNKGLKTGPQTEEDRKKKSDALKGKKKSEKTVENMTIAQSLREPETYARGWKQSEETIERFREIAANRPRLTCPHCGLEGALPGMKRYHFDNCKKASASSSD